jgi:hypothetical protein
MIAGDESEGEDRQDRAPGAKSPDPDQMAGVVTVDTGDIMKLSETAAYPPQDSLRR